MKTVALENFTSLLLKKNSDNSENYPSFFYIFLFFSKPFNEKVSFFHCFFCFHVEVFFTCSCLLYVLFFFGVVYRNGFSGLWNFRLYSDTKKVLFRQVQASAILFRQAIVLFRRYVGSIGLFLLCCRSLH